MSLLTKRRQSDGTPLPGVFWRTEHSSSAQISPAVLGRPAWKQVLRIRVPHLSARRCCWGALVSSSSTSKEQMRADVRTSLVEEPVADGGVRRDASGPNTQSLGTAQVDETSSAAATASALRAQPTSQEDQQRGTGPQVLRFLRF